MLIRNLISQEYYFFEEELEIKRIITVDSIGIVEFFSEDQCIEYTLDRNFCIRLSDLIHEIESNLIRFHFGQLLNLIILLLCKVVELEDKKIQHDYLDMNRIWLQLDEKSKKPNIIYQNLSYEIHFTGYQCPFYEQQNQQNLKINMKNKMRLIIKEILQRCYKSIEYLRTDQMYLKELEQNIIQPLTEKVEKLSFQDIISEIAIIKEDKQYEGNDQTLNFDHKFQDNEKSERAKWILKLNEDLESIIMYSKNFSVIVVEYLLHFYLPYFVKKISQKYKYNKSSLDYIQQCKAIFKKEEEIRTAYLDSFKPQIKPLIMNCINEYEQHYKFQFSEQMITQMEKEIIKSIQQHTGIKYFYNTFWMLKDNKFIIEQIILSITRIIKKVVQESVSLQIQLKILQLIQELI